MCVCENCLIFFLKIVSALVKKKGMLTICVARGASLRVVESYVVFVGRRSCESEKGGTEESFTSSFPTVTDKRPRL